MITKQDRQRLRELAHKATPGPWIGELDMFEPGEIVAVISDKPVNMFATIDSHERFYCPEDPDEYEWTAEHEVQKNAAWKRARESQALKDGEYIAAANPATMTALLDALDEAESALERIAYLENHGLRDIARAALAKLRGDS